MLDWPMRLKDRQESFRMVKNNDLEEISTSATPSVFSAFFSFCLHSFYEYFNAYIPTLILLITSPLKRIFFYFPRSRSSSRSLDRPLRCIYARHADSVSHFQTTNLSQYETLHLHHFFLLTSISLHDTLSTISPSGPNAIG